MSSILKIKDKNGNWIDIPAIIGLSAYEVAVKHGYDGTEEEWLESLKGTTPHIGENGNWFFGDIDSGVKADWKGDIDTINSTLLNHNLFINSEMPAHLDELRALVNNAPNDADGNIIKSASKESVEAMKDLFPKDAEGNLKEIVEYEVAVSDEFAQGRFASVGDEVYEVVSDDGDFSVNMTVALETSNDPHGNARIKLKIPEGKWDIYILNQDDTSSTVMMNVNGDTVAYGSSNLVSNKFLGKIMEKEDYFSDEVITLDLFMMELGGSCSLNLYCAYVVDGKDGLMSSEDKAKLESLAEEVGDVSTMLDATKNDVEALDIKLTENILKGSASGTIVAMKDVSPIEHEMGDRKSVV